MWFDEAYFQDNNAYDLEKSGQIHRAIEVYEQNILRDKNELFNYYRLLVLYRKNKDYSNEARIVKSALSNQPFDRPVENYLNERLDKINYLSGDVDTDEFKVRKDKLKAEQQKLSEKYNRSARIADIKRYMTMEFVVGYEIHQSSNPKHQNDICKMFEGKYPKSFLWDGCYEGCKCYLTSIMKTQEEFSNDSISIIRGEPLKSTSVNQVKSMPKNFYNYINDNYERLKNLKKAPGFIKFNFVEGDISKGLDYSKLGITPREENANKKRTIKSFFGL